MDVFNPDPYSYVNYDQPFASPPPFLPDMGLGDFGGMLSQLLASGLFGGGTSLGFNNSDNVHRSYQNQAQLAQHNERMRQMMMADSARWSPYIASFNKFMSTSLTPEKLAESDSAMKSAGAMLAPLIGNNAAAMRVYDALLPDSRASLGFHISRMSRYLQDPTTGAIGLSAESQDSAIDSIMRDFAGEKNRKRAFGMSTGQLGQVASELMQSGLGGENKTADMMGLKKSLDDKLQAVVAMQEVFGGMGQPNAPIPKIMAALQSLTGGMQQITGAQAKDLVRGLQSTADVTGVDMHRMSTLLNMNSQVLSAQGVNAAFAAPITQEQMLMRGAFNSSGLPTAWGMLSADQLSGFYSRRLVGATKSSSANLLGLAQRLMDGNQQITNTAEGRQMKAMLDEMKSGNAGAELNSFAQLSQAQQQQLVMGAFGIQANAMQYLLNDPNNMSAVFANRQQNVIAQMQQAEFFKNNKGAGTGALSAFIQGASGEQLSRIYNKAVAKLGSLSNSELSEEERQKQLSTVIREVANDEGLTVTSAQAGLASQALYGTLDQRYKERTGLHLVNLLASSSPATMEARKALARREDFMRSMGESVTQFSANPMMRMLRAVQSYGATDDASTMDVAMQALRIKPPDAVKEDVYKMFSSMIKRRNQTLSKYLNEDGTQKEDLTEEQKKAAAKEIADTDQQMIAEMEQLSKVRPEIKKFFDEFKARLAEGGDGTNSTVRALQLFVEKLSLSTKDGKQEFDDVEQDGEAEAKEGGSAEQQPVK